MKSHFSKIVLFLLIALVTLTGLKCTSSGKDDGTDNATGGATSTSPVSAAASASGR